MSKNINDIDRELLQNECPSVLDMLDAKNLSANRKTILHRVILVAKLRNNSSKIGEYYDRKFRTQQQQQQQNNQKSSNPFHEKVTGMLIIYPTLMIHVFESSLESIKSILSDMESMQKDEDGMILDSRILNFAHEVHIRLFPVYTYKIMNLSLEHDSSEPSDSIESLVSDITVRLLRLGKFLNDQSKVQLKKELIDNLHDQHPEFLPNQNYANFLLRSTDLWTPKEYLGYYEKPLDINLESELTWPAPSKIFPYN